MKLISKIKYLYGFTLIIFILFYVFFKPRPKLSTFFVNRSDPELFNNNSKNNKFSINPPNNRINVGESFLIKDNENWYRVIQLSFWRKKYFNLDFLNNQLNISDINVKSINNNNYASGTLQGEEIVYSCMRNSNEFNYTIKGKVVDSFDINHWKKVYFNNLNLVFYSFKPSNYECYVVLTPNINFFENYEFKTNENIFNRFNYK